MASVNNATVEKILKDGAVELKTKRTESSRFFMKPNGKTVGVYGSKRNIYAKNLKFNNIGKYGDDYYCYNGIINEDYGIWDGFADKARQCAFFEANTSMIWDEIENSELELRNDVTGIGDGKKYLRDSEWEYKLRKVANSFNPILNSQSNIEEYYNNLNGDLIMPFTITNDYPWNSIVTSPNLTQYLKDQMFYQNNNGNSSFFNSGCLSFGITRATNDECCGYMQTLIIYGKCHNPGYEDGTLFTITGGQKPLNFTGRGGEEKYILNTSYITELDTIPADVNYTVFNVNDWIHITNPTGTTVNGLGRIKITVDPLFGRNRSGTIRIRTYFPVNGKIIVNTEEIAIFQRIFDIGPASPKGSTRLLGNHPNPFNPETSIKFSIEKDSQVDLTVYNAKGENIKTLVNSNKNAGIHTVNFNATNLPTGMYYYMLKVNNTVVEQRKMLFVK